MEHKKGPAVYPDSVTAYNNYTKQKSDGRYTKSFKDFMAENDVDIDYETDAYVAMQWQEKEHLDFFTEYAKLNKLESPEAIAEDDLYEFLDKMVHSKNYEGAKNLVRIITKGDPRKLHGLQANLAGDENMDTLEFIVENYEMQKDRMSHGAWGIIAYVEKHIKTKKELEDKIAQLEARLAKI